MAQLNDHRYIAPQWRKVLCSTMSYARLNINDRGMMYLPTVHSYLCQFWKNFDRTKEEEQRIMLNRCLSHSTESRKSRRCKCRLIERGLVDGLDK